MWPRSAPGSGPSLLTCLLCLPLARAAPDQGLLELPPTVNLSIRSHNLKTILTWDVNGTFGPTNFNVEWRQYRHAEWKPVETCSNISVHHCDLTEVFSPNGKNMYYARVMAFSHFKDYPFAHTAKFSFKENATFDAPNVTIQFDGKNLIVEINHPVAHITSKTMRNVLLPLNYTIYSSQNGIKSQKAKVACSKFPCEVPLNVTRNLVQQENCCVSVQAYFIKAQLRGERSQQKCLLVQFTEPKGHFVIIVLSVCTIFLIVLVVSIVCGIKKFSKKDLVLPKSLAHLVMGGRPYTSVGMGSRESSVSVVIKIEEAVNKMTNLCEGDLSDEAQTEKESCQDIANFGETNLSNCALDNMCVNNINTRGTDQEGADQDSTEVGNVEPNETDVDSINPDETVTQTTKSDNISPVSTADNWGYDKPHVPLDMFTNCTDEQNGYRKASSAVEVD
uniref:Interferon gamma receptor 1 n=1 Tax=Callorhinchus milii TaxID=7868 RepID=A0A4W3K3U2_CALMI|eukprot:gi/632951240/ref/XP_007891180.1/ PREDICTED: interferon gamma receptor 1 isoform X2 [Callorhinchus milii]